DHGDDQGRHPRHERCQRTDADVAEQRPDEAEVAERSRAVPPDRELARAEEPGPERELADQQRDRRARRRAERDRQPDRTQRQRLAAEEADDRETSAPRGLLAVALRREPSPVVRRELRADVPGPALT